MIWKQEFTLEGINQISQNTLVDHLGIEFTGFGDDYLEATMPVDHRTVQPARLLHGGASAALAETIGSVASYMCIPDISTHMAVGVEINANHLRAVQAGTLTATATPVHRGRTTHVWQVTITDEAGRRVCVSRCTLALVNARERG